MPGTLITIERRSGESGDVIEARGELDLTNVDSLEEALSKTSSRTVILVLSELGFIDSAGIRTIDRVHRSLADAGRTLLIVAPRESRASWIFRVAGFADDFVLDSMDSALNAAARDGAS